MYDKNQIIKTLRKNKGLNQSHIAEALGVSTNSVSLIERGEGEIIEKEITLIAKVLGVSSKELTEKLSETKSTSDDWAQRLVDEMRAEIEELKKDKQNLNELLRMALQANGNFPEGDSLVPLIIHRNQELITRRAA